MSELQEGEQGLNFRCSDHFEGEDDIQFIISSDEEVDSAEDSDDFSMPKTEDEASLMGDSDGILENIPGLFESNQKLVLARTQDQVCALFENLKQVREFFFYGATRVF